jgi:ribosome-associated protein
MAKFQLAGLAVSGNCTGFTYVINCDSFCLENQNMLSIGRRIKIPLSEFSFSFARSAGPGGQNVNKVNSKAILRWPVISSRSLPEPVKERFVARYGRRLTAEGDLLVSSQRYRDQSANIEDCLEKVRVMVATVAAAPIPRRPTKPTLASKERRARVKTVKSQKKRLRRTPSLED